MKNLQHTSSRRAAGAFTLIELLVVIFIIGILAALILSGTAYAMKTVKIRRAQTELREIETALEAYKAKLGFYPPDGTNASHPPLFYELMGLYDPDANPATFDITTTDGSQTLTTNQIWNAFRVGGFANTAATRADARKFLNELSDRKIHDEGGIKYLRTSVPNPDSEPVPVWNYVSQNPINNPKTFDLWTDLVIRGQTNRVGNWRSGS